LTEIFGRFTLSAPDSAKASIKGSARIFMEPL
jgi:hypothetical protein